MNKVAYQILALLILGIFGAIAIAVIIHFRMNR